jgi:DNA-binding transcriptional LysR family regulator
VRIEQLEYLAAVTQHGSLRRASERLHISQPALSEAVSKLERELGVQLLDRRRSGARISREGRDLLQHMVAVLEAVDRLRAAAGDHRADVRRVRVGTVNAATTTLLVPAVAQVQREQPEADIELLTLQQAEIDQGLLEGTLDLGLVNLLAGDDPPPDLVGTDLVHGRPVVVMPAEHPLAARTHVDVDELRAQPFVAMRAGYLMHRIAHRVFGAEMPTVCHLTDGAEMGKALVAEGMGVTLLPDYSVVGDPLEKAGVITTRPIAGDTTVVTLVMRHRAAAHAPPPRQVRALQVALLDRARRYAGARAS